MCPIADATLFPEVHTLNGRMYKTALQLPSVGGDVSREAVLARSSCVYTKTCSGLENVVRTSFSMSGSVGLTPVITVGAM